MSNQKFLTPEELERVSGGFTETQGYATGFSIICPKCGSTQSGDFESNPVDALGQQYFTAV